MRHSRIMSLAIIIVIMAGLIRRMHPSQRSLRRRPATNTPAAAAEPTKAAEAEPAKTIFVVATDAVVPADGISWMKPRPIVGFDVDLMEAIAAEVGFYCRMEEHGLGWHLRRPGKWRL